jgi:hypothetical protein
MKVLRCERAYYPGGSCGTSTDLFKLEYNDFTKKGNARNSKLYCENHIGHAVNWEIGRRMSLPYTITQVSGFPQIPQGD